MNKLFYRFLLLITSYILCLELHKDKHGVIEDTSCSDNWKF